MRPQIELVLQRLADGEDIISDMEGLTLSAFEAVAVFRRVTEILYDEETLRRFKSGGAYASAAFEIAKAIVVAAANGQLVERFGREPRFDECSDADCSAAAEAASAIISKEIDKTLRSASMTEATQTGRASRVRGRSSPKSRRRSAR